MALALAFTHLLVCNINDYHLLLLDQVIDLPCHLILSIQRLEVHIIACILEMMRLRLWEAHVDNNIAYFCLDIVQIHEYVYMH